MTAKTTTEVVRYDPSNGKIIENIYGDYVLASDYDTLYQCYRELEECVRELVKEHWCDCSDEYGCRRCDAMRANRTKAMRRREGYNKHSSIREAYGRSGSQTERAKPMNYEIDSVVCLWEYNPKTKRWILEDVYGCDDNSYPCTKAKYATGRHGGYHRWLYKESGDWIPGRAVTCWSAESGVSLIDFAAPSQVDWIDWYKFKDVIKENWVGTLQGAYDMKMETATKAMELITRDENTIA